MKVLKASTRKMIFAAAVAVAGCGMFLGGCSREESVTVQQPAPGAPAAQVIDQPQSVVVQEAPPAMIVEVRPAAPSGEHVWIDGSWNWDNKRYTWQAGRYEVPPQAGAVWVAPRYEHDAKGYRYTAGQWQKPVKENERGHDRG